MQNQIRIVDPTLTSN